MSSEAKLLDAFTNLSYESVLDSDAAIKAWIASHNNCFTPIIDGAYLPLSEQFNVKFSAKNPFNGTEITKLVKCDQNIVDLALKSAKKASQSWSKLGFIGRGRVLYNIVRNLQKHLTVVCLLEALSTGRTVREVKDLDVATIIKTLYYYSGSNALVDANFDSYEAHGVVALAPHWDNSLLSLVPKLAAALASGNTCIIVPHKLAPLSAFMFVDICIQAGLPNGVINVVMSDDEKIYKQIASHPSIDCVSFDGTTQDAQELIVKQGYHLPNKSTLFTLSGKSSILIYDTADVDSAVESVVDGCFYANGQHRFSVNKVLVQENIYQDVLKRLERRFQKLRVGNHLDKCNDYGPFISEAELNKLKNELESQKPTELKQYPNALQDKTAKTIYSPTIITNLQTNTEFYQNEPNGPYVIVLPFRTVKESVEMINTSRFGSAISIWSQNISLVMEVAYSVQVGTVWVNGVWIEKGVETRKTSGNYHIAGVQSLLNFMKPKWQTPFDGDKMIDIEKVEKTLKTFGSTSPSAAIPAADPLSTTKTYKLYIGGKQARPDGQGSKCIYVRGDESTKKVACLVADASRKDVRNAVEAANAAFNDWKKRVNHNKAQILFFFGENLAARREEFINKLEAQTNKTKAQCEREFDLSLNFIFYYASLCDKYVGRLNDTTEYGTLLELSEPIGVIGIVCGHSNYPLLSFIVHSVGAIAFGNSVVIVPDEKSPVPAMDLYEVFETSDMPGVVNMLTGNKQHLTKYLCEHQQVSSIWYMTDADEKDLSAIQFIRYTSNFNLKHNWIIKNEAFQPTNDDEFENFLFKKYTYELNNRSVQYKYIHIPMGVIFAN